MADSAKSYDERNDDWVRRLQGAEPDRGMAISELREILVRGVGKSLSTHYGSGIHPDDVVQDALIKILASLEKFEGRSRFTTWAMTIAIRTGINKLRRKHFRDVSLDSMKGGENLAISIEEDRTGNRSEQQKVLGILKDLIENQLTPRQREATQGLLDGLPVEEIARRTNSNRNAVYKLVHDARLRLRKGFAESGIATDDFNAIFA